MTANNTNNNVSIRGFELMLSLLVLGLTKASTTLGSIMIGKVSYTPTDLIKKLEPWLKLWTEARLARLAAESRVTERDRFEVEAREFVLELRSAIATALGKTNPELSEYGISPKKRPRELTVEEKALRAERAKLTREKRGTKGPRARAAIKATGPIAVTLPKPATP